MKFHAYKTGYLLGCLSFLEYFDLVIAHTEYGYIIGTYVLGYEGVGCILGTNYEGAVQDKLLGNGGASLKIIIHGGILTSSPGRLICSLKSTAGTTMCSFEAL